MSLSHEITMNVDLTGAIEFPIYAPSEGEVQLEKITLLPGADAALEATDYTTIQVLDKGSDGAQNDVIATLHTEDIAGGIALSANVKQEIALAATGPYTLNYGLTLKKADNSAPVDIQESTLILKVREVG